MYKSRPWSVLRYFLWIIHMFKHKHNIIHKKCRWMYIVLWCKNSSWYLINLELKTLAYLYPITFLYHYSTVDGNFPLNYFTLLLHCLLCIFVQYMFTVELLSWHYPFTEGQYNKVLLNSKFFSRYTNPFENLTNMLTHSKIVSRINEYVRKV